MNKRGRTLTVLACICAVVAAQGWADAVADAWARVYRRMPDLEQRYQVMQNIVALDNSELIPLLSESLGELMAVREQRSRTEEVLWESLVRLIVRELGELGAQEAGPLLFRVAEEVRDPIVRSEALVALGYAGATDFADEVALLLRNLTLYRGSRVEGEETLVYGAIIALEKLHRDVGYEPVFSASIAGYPERITSLAQGALSRMITDPTPILMRIVREEESVSVKRSALRQGLGSQAPGAARVGLCAAALEQGLVRRAGSLTEATALRQLRTEAMGGLVALRGEGTELPAEVAGLAGRVLDLDTDVNERLNAVETLRAASGERGAGLLLAYLTRSNDRQTAGLSATADQIRLITATIQAIGAVGAKGALQELVRTQNVETWPSSVIREAKAVAQALGAAN